MPGNSEEYGASHYEDERTEYQDDWSIYDDWLEDACDDLELFKRLAEQEGSDRHMGMNAQGAPEHGMKALLEAHGAACPHNHDIGDILGNIRRVDPDMPDFRLSIDPARSTLGTPGDTPASGWSLPSD